MYTASMAEFEDSGGCTVVLSSGARSFLLGAVDVHGKAQRSSLFSPTCSLRHASLERKHRRPSLGSFGKSKQSGDDRLELQRG